MTVGEIFDSMQFVNKKLLSGAIQPDSFNLALNVVNIDTFNLKTGLVQEYRPGDPRPRQAYEVSVRITDDIKKFRKYVDIQTNGYNQYVQPGDYGAFSSMRYPRYITKRGKPEVDWRVVNILTDEEYNDRISSKLLT